jgi:uncharacterized spore protein YtfJ
VELDENSLKEILGKLGVSSVFGDPVKRGDISIIPVAETKIGLGFGSGGGSRGSGESEEEEKAGDAEGDESCECGMTGYGGGGRVTPKGFIKFKGDTVSYEPIIDVTKIAIAGIALAAWIVYRITRFCTCEEE